jgi:hypothetical protein
MNKELDFIYVINNINHYNEIDNLIISNEIDENSLNEKCIVVNNEFLENEKNIITENKFVIPFYIIIDVEENLKYQKKNFTNQDFIKALIFYLKNDAFIEISAQR